MMAGRMLRDGWSLKKIRAELSVAHYVSDAVLERACVNGLTMLEAAIARGEEPAESVIDREEVKALVRHEGRAERPGGLVVPGDPDWGPIQ